MNTSIQRPVIGVISNSHREGAHALQAIGEKYLSAIATIAGALPLIIPALPEPLAVDDLVASLDGLLLPGGYSNIDPVHYGVAEAPRDTTLQDAQRDATALQLIHAAINAGLPLLGICRGHQEINVALGGTLHQAVHEVPGCLDHREDCAQPLEVQYGPSHEVSIEPGGLLAHWLPAQRRWTVNSVHGQGIDHLADGLQIEARAPDGLIEAVSLPAARALTLGVQWHPEWEANEQLLSYTLLVAFGAACRERRFERSA